MRALRCKATTLIWLVLVSVGGFGALAAGPEQGVPPRPFFPDYFFGTVLVQGAVPPRGIQLVACVDDCDTVFASAPALVGELGSFRGLAVGPKDEALVGHVVRFYLVNEHGRIPATETVTFTGALELRHLNLTFRQPVPSLAMAPTPPAVGDWLVPILPKIALALGAAMALGGGWLLVAGQRRDFRWTRPTEEPRRVGAKPIRVAEIGETKAPL